MKKQLLYALIVLLFTGYSIKTEAQKYVGGDLSLVPAYEAAGDQWLDADGHTINTYYTDGMITYVHEVAGWNAVRVRLLVDPSQDTEPATCQDLAYVKALGKRIKDAGMQFLLDIFYSDTWTDVSKQWIPASWGYDRTTATATLAAKVKSYTTEVLNELVTAGAKPDFVQIGNEVSYGMLWDSAAGGNKGTHYFATSGTYDAQTAKITRFATLLKAAAEGVRASSCSTAKIVLHCERTGNSTGTVNFYSWVRQAGFTDYDIIGLSYYPLWHNDLAHLKATLSALQTNFPSKQIHIVETGYHNAEITPKSGEYNTSATWAYTPAGQASFLTDLIAALKTYPNVTGLYYWQPEECGNGADASGNNRVMGAWDQRGFWALTWKSGTHTLDSKDALMVLKTFTSDDSTPEDPEETDISSQFTNLDFETGDGTGWTINNAGWGNGPWPVAINQWHSALVSGTYCLQSWVSSGNSLTAGDIIYQSLDNLPAGTYTVSAVVHTDHNGIYLFANDDTKLVTATSTWGTAETVSVTTTLSAAGKLTIGLKLATAPTGTSEVNLYADNFKVTQQTSGLDSITATPALSGAWYSIDGRRLPGKPTTPGIYINSGKKLILK